MDSNLSYSSWLSYRGNVITWSSITHVGRGRDWLWLGGEVPRAGVPLVVVEVGRALCDPVSRQEESPRCGDWTVMTETMVMMTVIWQCKLFAEHG